MNLQKLAERKEVYEQQLKFEYENIRKYEAAIQQAQANINAIGGALQDVEFWRAGILQEQGEEALRETTVIQIRASGEGAVSPEVTLEQPEKAIDEGGELNLD